MEVFKLNQKRNSGEKFTTKEAARDILLTPPEGMTYQTGDHLAVYPTNPPALIERACQRLGISASDLIQTNQQHCPAHLPVNTTLRVGQLVPTEWVLLDIRIHAVANGFGHGVVHLWAQDGTLLATASQSTIVRMLPPEVIEQMMWAQRSDSPDDAVPPSPPS